MTVDLSRRSFLKALAGTAVIVSLPAAVVAAIPDAAPRAVSADPVPPAGMTYQWVRTHLLGEPDIENVEARIGTGWTFVAPKDQPHIPTENAALAIEHGGLILMQKPTVMVEAQRLEEYKANMRRAAKIECPTCGEFSKCACNKPNYWIEGQSVE